MLSYFDSWLMTINVAGLSFLIVTGSLSWNLGCFPTSNGRSDKILGDFWGHKCYHLHPLDCRLQMICMPVVCSIWYVINWTYGHTCWKETGGGVAWIRKRAICSTSIRNSIKFHFFHRPLWMFPVVSFWLHHFPKVHLDRQVMPWLSCQGRMYFLLISWVLWSLRSFVGPPVLLHMLIFFTWEMAVRLQSNRKIRDKVMTPRFSLNS